MKSREKKRRTKDLRSGNAGKRLKMRSYAFHVVVDSSKVNPYRDVVKKEGVVVKEEDQLDVDVKGSFLLLDVLRDQGNPFKLCLHVFLFYFLLTQFPVWSELFMLSLQGRNLVIEHSWGALKVKNVVASLVKDPIASDVNRQRDPLRLMLFIFLLQSSL
ncbi:hypothetical protein Bca4012_080956 [Brassica carinata]